MIYKQAEKLPDGCLLLKGRTVTDDRGSLTVVEKSVLPFSPQRIFWITGVPEGKRRGGHSHVSCSEAVFVAQGAFSMFVSDGDTSTEIRLSSPESGILIPCGIWCELRDFTPDCVCVVMASEAYDRNGYINSYEEYLRFRAEKQSAE